MQPFEPSETYEGLLRQCRALATIIHCLEQRLEVAERPRREELSSARQLDSMKEANRLLTDEADVMQSRFAALDEAVTNLFRDRILDLEDFPHGHPFRGSIRRCAGNAVRKKAGHLESSE
jgi:hypothetical protein